VNTTTRRAFLISKGAVTILGKLGGSFSTGQGLNASGEVVGGSPPSSVQGQHAVVFRGTRTPTDIGTLGGASSVANAVNDNGVIHDAALFDLSKSTSTGLGNLGSGNSDSQANDVNTAGVVVGASGTQSGSSAAHAFIWTKSRGLRDLNGLISSTSGWTLSSA